MTYVSRRHFGRLAAAGAAAAAASPALAQQTSETVKWRLTSSFPKSLDTLFGASTTIARVVGEMTDGKFTIQTFAAGEIVPGLQVLDAVSNATVECGHTYTGYYIGKNPALIFDGSLPFGFTPRQHNAWLLFGDGRKLMDEVYDSFGVDRPALRADRRPDVRLVPQGAEDRRGFPGPQDAHRRFRRPRHGQARRRSRSRSPAATSTLRWRRAPSTPANGSVPTTTRSSASTRSPSTTTRPASWSSRQPTHLFIHKAAWAALPPRYQAVLQLCVLVCVDGDARVLRCQERQGDCARGGGRGPVVRAAAGGRSRRCAPRSKPCSTRKPPRASSSRRSWTIGASSAPISTAGLRLPIRGRNWRPIPCSRGPKRRATRLGTDIVRIAAVADDAFDVVARDADVRQARGRSARRAPRWRD